MLGLKTESFNLPLLVIVSGGERVEAMLLEVALVIDMTSEVIKDPLD